MDEEQGLSPANLALLEREFPQWLKDFGAGYWTMKPASINRLLDAARSEGLQPVSVKGGELRRVLDGLGYQAVFNAIGAAVEWRTGRVLGISVERFIFSLTGIKRQDEIVDIDAEDARAMSPEALETAAEGAGTVSGLVAAATALLDACHKDFGVPDETDEDDEAVGGGLEGPCAVQFGHMRRLSTVLAAFTAKGTAT